MYVKVETVGVKSVDWCSCLIMWIPHNSCDLRLRIMVVVPTFMKNVIWFKTIKSTVIGYNHKLCCNCLGIRQLLYVSL